MENGTFTRADGPADAPVVTWLHGFPTSSWDWAPLHQALGAGRRDVTLDFLGFGASAKPRGHDYTLTEQADLVEAVWDAHGVTETALVAHDYGVSVAQELLARRGEGRLSVTLTAATFLNGGIFPHLHRPIRIQTLMVGPFGPLLARLSSERQFARALRAVMSIEPGTSELHEHWRAFSRDRGNRNIHRLLAYMAERRVHEERWVGALVDCDLAMRFIWGPEDPVSGAHVVPEIRVRMPGAAVHVLDGVGHYPQLEATRRVASAFDD
ncbi:Haloalkane dehalogenase [Paraconexibacter sp. AEG42_29]|uniref:Haloalkane dehalogenase n=1 Tax=Paraconexibacter sp. AEG42_29 TaxID=2997339 RepID=A0AAU7AYR3_9ACTN